MDSVVIPITGDLSGITAAMTELAASMRAMTAQIAAGMAPVQASARQVAANVRGAGTAGKQASMGFLEFASRAGKIGSVAAAVLSTAAAGVTLYKAIKSDAQSAREAGAALRAMAGRVVALAAATATLVVAVRTVRAGFSALGSVAGATLRGIGSAASAAGRTIKGAFSGLSSGLSSGGLLGPLAGLAVGGGTIALAISQLRGAFQAATAFEMLQTRVESFLGSAAAAKSLLADLSKFADATQFETVDVQEAAGALLGAGVRDNVAGITKDLAAVSRDGQQLRDLADALGKGFAKGKFQTEELNKFLERQVNLMPALAAATGKTGDELSKAIEAGIRFDTVSRAIASMSAKGGQFEGILGRLAMTTTGLVSTLSGSWDSLRRTFAQPILDAIKPVIADAINLVEKLKPAAQAAGKAIGDALLGIYALVKSGRTFEVMRAGVSLAFAGATDVLMRGVQGAIAFLSTALPPIFEAAVAKLHDPSFWEGLSVFMSGVAKTFSAEIRAALMLGSDRWVENDRRGGQIDQRIGRGIMAGAAGVDFGSVVRNAMTDAAAAAAAILKRPISEDFAAQIERFRALLGSVDKEAAAMRAGTAIPEIVKGATGQTTVAPLQGGLFGKASDLIPVVSSLARVGGAALPQLAIATLSKLTERANRQRETTNATLRRIEEKISNTAPQAVFA